MVTINIGIQNELQFAKFLDHKKVGQLPMNYQELLKSIFTEINDNSTIGCWKSNRLEKADIKIKINSEVKGISIKMGSNCSVHQEKDENIFKFLIKIGIEDKIITYLHEFIIGKIDDKKVDAETYIKNNLDKIQKINNALNDFYIKTNLIIRFLFLGTEKQNYDCDAIIHGTTSNFLWATKSEILNYLLKNQNKNIDSINISTLRLKCYDRNLRNSSKRKSKENDIQIKWYSIRQDLQKITQERQKKSK